MENFVVRRNGKHDRVNVISTEGSGEIRNPRFEKTGKKQSSQAQIFPRKIPTSQFCALLSRED